MTLREHFRWFFSVLVIFVAILGLSTVGESERSNRFNVVNNGDNVIVKSENGEAHTFSMKSNFEISRGSTVIKVEIDEKESGSNGRLEIDEWNHKILIAANSKEVEIELLRNGHVDVAGTVIDARRSRSEVADAIVLLLDGVSPEAAAAMFTTIENELNSKNMRNGDEVRETIKMVADRLA